MIIIVFVSHARPIFVLLFHHFPCCHMFPNPEFLLNQLLETYQAYTLPFSDTWPPKFNSSRIRADVAKQFLLACPLGLVLHGLPGSGYSSTIPVVCKRCIRQSITEWCTPICPATLLLIRPACDMPTACHISAKVYYCLTIIQQWKHSIRKTLHSQLAKTICVIRYLFTSFNRTQLFSNDDTFN